MNITLMDATTIFTCDPAALGAAVKIVAAKHENSPDADQQRVSGMTAYVWTRKRDQVRALFGSVRSTDRNRVL